LERLRTGVVAIETWTPPSDPGALFRYIDISSVDRESKRITGASELSVKNAPSRARQLLRANDVLVSTVRPNLNAVAIVPPEFDGAVGTTGVTVLRANPRRLLPEYVFHWVRTPMFIAEMVKNATGASYPAVTDRLVLDSEIPVLPLAEQRRIVDILNAADELRAKRRAALEELEALIQSVFMDMFGDPIANPKGFQIRALPDFYINNEEGTKCGPFGSALKKHELVEAGVPVWNMDNIGPNGRSVLPFRMWITRDKYRQLKAYSVQSGDVVISRAGTVGKMCVADTSDNESIISTNLIRLRLGEGLLPIFFVSLMTYCKGRVGRLKTGPDGSFTHMNTGILDKLSFPYPPVRLQKQFAAVVESVEQQRRTQRAHLAELDVLFASLQSRAFSGGL
jgi:type I restriction enzyme S subunit